MQSNINQEKSNPIQEQSTQQKTITNEMDKILKNINSEEAIRNFKNLFPKAEEFKENDGNKSVEEIRAELPKKELYGVYKTYDVFDEKGITTLY